MSRPGPQFPPLHLDARPGGRGPFSPPQEVDDYAAWLDAACKACERQEGRHTLLHGVGQQLQHTIQAARAGATVRTTGRYAGALAAVIEVRVNASLSDEERKRLGRDFEVEVLG